MNETTVPRYYTTAQPLATLGRARYNPAMKTLMRWLCRYVIAEIQQDFDKRLEATIVVQRAHLDQVRDLEERIDNTLDIIGRLTAQTRMLEAALAASEQNTNALIAELTARIDGRRSSGRALPFSALRHKAEQAERAHAG